MRGARERSIRRMPVGSATTRPPESPVAAAGVAQGLRRPPRRTHRLRRRRRSFGQDAPDVQAGRLSGRRLPATPASCTPPRAHLMNDDIKREVSKRRTFAIISHPDAGKTTLTEKLLL